MPASSPSAARGFVAWALVAACLLASGCASLQQNRLDSALAPSNDRDWRPNLAKLSTAKIKDDRVSIKNIRNCSYVSEDDYVVDYYNETFQLDDLRSVDFIVVPFKDAPSLAHTMVSFDFEDKGHLVVSVEARLEKGEVYSPLNGSLRQYELIYVIGDERDLIRLRTEVRDVDVYVYRTNATPEQSRQLLIHVLQRANQLAEYPEFYDSLTNNCTTNLAYHVNQIRPNRIPLADLRLLLPGHSDRLAYELGLLDTSRPFEELKREAKINYLAHTYATDPDFSNRIRRR